MIFRANDRQYSPDTIEPIPELIEDDDSLTCSISDNVTCMANEDTLMPQHGGMLLLKSTTSSLDTSFTELSSPHEVNLLRVKRTPQPHVLSPSYKCITFTVSRSCLAPLV